MKRNRNKRFGLLLGVSQAIVAACFGGFGTYQRNRILNQPFLDNQTLWETTARFHIWPWPLKFAIIMNFPAAVGTAIFSLPLAMALPRKIADAVEVVVLFTFVFVIWFSIASRIGASVRSIAFVLLFITTAVVGASLLLGNTGYIPYGLLLWVLAGVVFEYFRIRGTASQLLERQ